MQIQITGLTNLQREIRALTRRADGLLTGIAPDITQQLERSKEQRFNTETNPQGQQWAALSPAYLASKRKRESVGADRILVLDDIMRNSYLSVLQRGTYMYGTNDKKAITHQEGRGKIKRREHLGLTQDDVQAISRMAVEFLGGNYV